jgi:hypothetical protein
VKIIDHAALKGIHLNGGGSKEAKIYLKTYNIERVRGFFETHLGCTIDEVAYGLKLSRRTVSSAVAILRKEWYGK